MLSLLTDHPLLSALILILIDLALWRLIAASGSNWKLAVRLVIFFVVQRAAVQRRLEPHGAGALGRQRAVAPGSNRFANWLVAVRRAHPDGVDRCGDDATGRTHRALVAGSARRGDFS